KYVDAKKDDPAGYEGRGRALFNLKKFKEAVADFDAYLAKSKPADTDRADIERLKVLALESDPSTKLPAEERIAKYTELINKAPDAKESSTLYVNRGVAHFEKGNFDTALKDFEAAAKLDGGQPSTLANVASAAFRKADKSKAAADYTAAAAAYDRILTKEPANTEALLSRADIQLALKKYTEAIADYGKVIASNPETKTLVAVLTNRAAAYLMLPKPDTKAAIADYTAILAKSPTDTTVLGLRAMAHKSLSDWASAAADFTKLIEAGKPKVDIELLLSRAECTFNLGIARKDTPTKGGPEFDSAIADYTAVLTEKADNADALFSRGLAYYRKSGRKALPELAKAIADFEALVKVKTDHADAWYRIGLAADDYGVASEPDQEAMFTKAIAAYEKYITLPKVSATDIESTKKRIEQLKEAL
ncbi:MAG: tetratricopeptide repeat protein, partial [Armatimonadaceae bacterium]